MGVTELAARNAQEERALRASLNSHTRRNEVTTLQTQLAEAQRKLAEREARDAATEKWMGRPEYPAALAKYEEIKNSFGQAEADAYWRGVNADLENLANEEYETRIGQVEQTRIRDAAVAWKNEAWANVNTMPKMIREMQVFPQLFEQAVESFNEELRLGHYEGRVRSAEDAHREFMRFFNGRVLAQPEVTRLYKALKDKEASDRTAAAAKAAEDARKLQKVKDDAVEEFKKQVAANRTEAPPHPLGNLAAASRDRLPAGSEAAAETAANVPVSQLRKDAKAASRQLARQRFGIT